MKVLRLSILCLRLAHMPVKSGIQMHLHFQLTCCSTPYPAGARAALSCRLTHKLVFLVLCLVIHLSRRLFLAYAVSLACGSAHAEDRVFAMSLASGSACIEDRASFGYWLVPEFVSLVVCCPACPVCSRIDVTSRLLLWHAYS